MTRRTQEAVNHFPSLRWSADDVAYDAEAHTSRLPDGTDVPHVTAILAAVGVSTDFSCIGDISPRVEDAIRLAAARGTAVHADCHALDDGELDLSDCDVRVRPYVEAWAECKADLKLEPVLHARERRVFHPLHVYAGIQDGIVRRGAKQVLIDLKTGDPNDASAHLQTSAYATAYLDAHQDVRIDERWAVWLRPDLAGAPYRVVNYTAPDRPDHYMDFQKFAACLTTFREQPSRRRRIA